MISLPSRIALFWWFTSNLYTFRLCLIVSKLVLVELVLSLADKLLKLQEKVMSSAKKANMKNFELFGKVLMSIRKNRGSSMESWER